MGFGISKKQRFQAKMTLNQNITDSDSRFNQALDYLYNRTNYENFVKIPYDRLYLNMDRLARFLDWLGRPDAKMKIVHIAGTKGKGSVSMMLEKILRAEGIRTGLFTSPHLYSVLERFAVMGQPCSEDEFADVLFDLKDRLAAFSRENPDLCLAEEPFTFFEWSVLIALELFVRREVEIAVMEVGLGGRFDATNLCRTDVSAITSISYDHMDYLGETLEKIASEKAGIIRSGTPAVCGVGSSMLFPQNEACSQHLITSDDVESVRNVIRKKAKECGAPFYSVESISSEVDHLALPFYGRHQRWNFEIVRKILDILGIGISLEKMAGSLTDLTLPARLETVWKDPLVFIDGAHNRASVAALVQSLREYVRINKKNGPKTLLFAVSSGKDIEGMIAEFETFFDEFAITSYESGIRAVPVDQLAQKVRNCVKTDITVTAVSDLAGYLGDYLKKSKGKNGLCCAAGSFYFASEIASSFKKKGENFISAD